MSTFFWNICGFNKLTKHDIVRDWINKGKMNFGGLVETRVKENKAAKIILKVFKDWSVMSNYGSNRLGRIWVVWNSIVRLTPVFTSADDNLFGSH